MSEDRHAHIPTGVRRKMEAHGFLPSHVVCANCDKYGAIGTFHVHRMHGKRESFCSSTCEAVYDNRADANATEALVRETLEKFRARCDGRLAKAATEEFKP